MAVSCCCGPVVIQWMNEYFGFSDQTPSLILDVVGVGQGATQRATNESCRPPW